MRLTTLLLLIFAVSIISGCESGANKQVVADREAAKTNTQAPNLKGDSSQAGQLQARLQTADAVSFAKQPAQTTQAGVSLTQADAANAASQAIERKIIRNANLTIEVASPTESQRKIFSVAESHGGFVVTSEMTQQTSEDKSKPTMSVNLVARVPALQFDQVMEEIRGVASRVVQEKRTGQDVTEEFIDLEARMKNQ